MVEHVGNGKCESRKEIASGDNVTFTVRPGCAVRQVNHDFVIVGEYLPDLLNAVVNILTEFLTDLVWFLGRRNDLYHQVGNHIDITSGRNNSRILNIGNIGATMELNVIRRTTKHEVRVTGIHTPRLLFKYPTREVRNQQ